MSEYEARIAVMEHSLQDQNRRITAIEGSMSETVKALQDVRETQTTQTLQLDHVGKSLDRLCSKLDHEENERRAWSAWVKTTFDARTIAIILAVLGGFFGVSMENARVVFDAAEDAAE